jgi:squalene-hopene/tetraprenyl-beta-curcumene cyclase
MMLALRNRWIAAFAALAVVASAGRANAADAAPDYDKIVANAKEFLLARGQAADGSFSAQAGPAVTGLVVTALLKNGASPDDPAIAKSLDYIKGFVHEDGGIYGPESKVQNYETAMAVMCFSEANKDGRYDELLAGAEKFLRKLQWDDDEGHDQSSASYGGAGYGGHQRPDMSNTQFFLDALKALKVSDDDPAVQKALIFVSRCQNLESEHNTFPFAAKVNDGGFYYTIAAGGTSQAGPTDNGGLRSYGSMTYAGLKSMIYAGVNKDDPRVKAAVAWLQKHYDLKENPGMGNAGLYYYYHTFAKSLDAFGQDEFVDAEGTSHNWREELVAALAAQQKPDGSFLNENARWMEGDANLVTGYALLALSYAKPQ